MRTIQDDNIIDANNGQICSAQREDRSTAIVLGKSIHLILPLGVIQTIGGFRTFGIEPIDRLIVDPHWLRQHDIRSTPLHRKRTVSILQLPLAEHLILFLMQLRFAIPATTPILLTMIVMNIKIIRIALHLLSVTDSRMQYQAVIIRVDIIEQLSDFHQRLHLEEERHHFQLRQLLSVAHDHTLILFAVHKVQRIILPQEVQQNRVFLHVQPRIVPLLQLLCTLDIAGNQRIVQSLQL
mmetsp:Transcript_62096/g.98819  ORF Transcript_62096/g.98819 Transcript_62096/m.98819 type:complete len:238 (-) Transcript_62096:842-1555(-)